MLYNINGDVIPERPKGSNDEVWKKAITDVVSRNFSNDRELIEEPEDVDMFISDLIKYSDYYDDAYEIARRMDLSVWDVNFDFVVKINNITECALRKIREFEKEWAKEYMPVPKFGVGDRCLHKGEVGEITGLNADLASYELTVGESTYLIEYEDSALRLY